MLSKPLRGRRVNQRHWSAKGLVGSWLFNEGSGTKVFDSSGHGNTGTLTNIAAPPTATSGWGAGGRGTGLRVDGDNDYVNGGNDPSLNLTGTLTIAAWVQANVTQGTSYNPIVCKGLWRYALELNSERKVTVWINNSDSLQATNGISADVWHHLVWVHSTSPDEDKIYVDGTTDTYGAIGNLPNASSDPLSELGISGGAVTATNLFRGSIDSVRIYNRTLSIEEIQELYRDEYAIFNPPFSPENFYIPAMPRNYGYIF